jgi:hypothetical protein
MFAGTFAAVLFCTASAAHAVEAPFGGTPAAIPGTVQAENYDTGGQGVAYNVTSVNGTGNGYRSDGVDIEATTDTGGGVNLGWTAAGQWFKYTVNVATAGTYTVTFRVAAIGAVTDAFHISNSSGTNLSGSVNVPATGAWQAWTNVTATVTLTAGTQTLTLDQDKAGWNINYFTFTASGAEAPFGGTPAAVPGTVQAENYDTGGQGIAYKVTSIHGTANSYRADGVDIEATTDTGGGFNIGWTAAGQWFKYTVNVAVAGTYTVTFRVAAESAIGDAFHISTSAGTNLSGSVAVPDTGGWQTWSSATATVTLPAGVQTLTLNQDNAGWNINWFSFAAGSTSGCTSKPSVPTGLAASGTTSSSTTLSWTASTAASGCAVTSYTVYEDGSAIATVTGGTSYGVSGLAASTTYSYTVAATDSDGTSGQSSAVEVTTSSSGGGGGAGTTTGAINFHLLLGVSGSTAGDSMTLTGGNYSDLIMSNMIAGVMYGHIVEEGFPGIQFNKDYLYGSIMGQLLQENLQTEAYESSSNLIDPTAYQQAVMGQGQGGPYQINNYVDDMVAGAFTAEGHALVNYIAIQKNIGYTVAGNAAQADAVTPPSFNNKYYGPMLPAFFHYNDMVALNIIGTGPNGWVTPWQPEYDEALANFVNLPNSFLDVILNVAYNQGYYGGLVASYSTLGATASASTVATVDSYSSVWGNSSTYSQYPYQVHYYLDQMYGNPIPTTSPTTTTTPGNHIAFSMSELETVFTNVFELLDYSNGTAAAQYFTAAQAQTAFNAALSSNGVSSSATLDLSTASQRAQIFAVINSAITNLETASGMKFNATTTSQL